MVSSATTERDTAMQSEPSAVTCATTGWPLERALFAIAGTVTLLSAALAAFVSPWFLVLTAFVGVNQWSFVAVGACPMSLILSRAFGFESRLAAPVSR